MKFVPAGADDLCPLFLLTRITSTNPKSVDCMGRRAAEFIEEDGQLVYKETITHHLNEHRGIYVARNPEEGFESVYQLHKVPDAEKYFWGALFSTASYAMHPTNGDGRRAKRKNTHKTMAEAITTKLKDGWEVRRCNDAVALARILLSD